MTHKPKQEKFNKNNQNPEDQSHSNTCNHNQKTKRLKKFWYRSKKCNFLLHKLWSGRGRIRAIRWKCRVSDILVHVSFRDQHRRAPPWPWLMFERFWEKPRKLWRESYGCWESWVERSGWTMVQSVKCWGLCWNGRHVQRERKRERERRLKISKKRQWKWRLYNFIVPR